MIWNYKHLSRLDFRMLPLIASLMGIGLLVISSYSSGAEEGVFFTKVVRSQIEWYVLGGFVYFFFAGFDYNRLREWTWILYGLMIISLIGLFFTDSIQRVHRWYRIPFLGFNAQPSEFAKLVVVVALAWLLEKKGRAVGEFGTVGWAALIVGIPFLLILKQPDLGSALVLFPIALAIFYYGGIHSFAVKSMAWGLATAVILVSSIFLGVIPHETLRPSATLVMKDYQFERLNPNTHHQQAATTAIAVGGIVGKGWRQSDYTSGGWLPAPYTDSVFPAFGEEFGLLGLILLLALFYALLYCCFQVSAIAKNEFGRLLAVGISVYLAMHVLINVGMMSGFLPITGVPLLLVTYGGSSTLFVMMALGVLQNIYSQRFMF